MAHFPQVSGASLGLSDTVFSALVNAAKRRSGPIFPLHVGDTYLEPPLCARAESQRTEATARLHNYANVQGEPALLAAISAKLSRQAGRPIDPECIQVTPGATAGLNIVAQSILSVGDEVLVLSPYWPLVRGVFAAKGVVPVDVPFYCGLNEPGFDLEARLGAAITDRTAAIYLNSPHNPTGKVLEDRELELIAEIARRNRLWVISDEAYEDLWFGDTAPSRVWTNPTLAERTIALHTFSKSYGLAGARVGYIHGPPSAMQPIRSLQVFQTYCASKPMQLGAARALSECDSWLENTRRVYAEAARTAADALDLRAPLAGTFLFFEVTPWLRPGETALGFLERCLDAGVLLTPGSASGRNYENWVRLCFTAVPLHDLREALDRLQSVIRAPR